MKHIIAAAVLSIIFTSCKKEATTASTVTAQLGDNILEEGVCAGNVKGQNNVSVCFNKLVEDTRCPVNTVCNGRAVAVANFTLNTGSTSITFNLATLQAYTYVNDTIINNTRFTLKDVTPYPGQAGYNEQKKKVTLALE